MKKFVSKFLLALLVVVTVASMMCSSAFCNKWRKSTCAQKDATVRRIGAAFIAPTTVLRQPSYNYFKNRRSAKPLLQQFFVQEQLLHFQQQKALLRQERLLS